MRSAAAKRKLEGKHICWKCGTPYRHGDTICVNCGMQFETGKTVRPNAVELDGEETATSWFVGVVDAVVPGLLRPAVAATAIVAFAVGLVVMLWYAQGLLDAGGISGPVFAALAGIVLCGLGALWLVMGSYHLIELAEPGAVGWIVWAVLMGYPLVGVFIPIVVRAVRACFAG